MITTSIVIAAVVYAFLAGGILAGMLAARRLPEEHLSAETRTLVTATMAIVGTLSALVIGLLISTGSASLRARNADVGVLASEILQLDRILSRYGPEAAPARTALADYARQKTADLFPGKGAAVPQLNRPTTLRRLDDMQDRILELAPANDRQAWLKGSALRHSEDLADARDRLVREDVGSIPIPSLGAMVLWLTVLFASFALFAPRNATAVAAMFLCALAIASAIKLVLDEDTPFDGRIRLVRPPIHVSGEPLRQAMRAIGR